MAAGGAALGLALRAVGEPAAGRAADRAVRRGHDRSLARLAGAGLHDARHRRDGRCCSGSRRRSASAGLAAGRAQGAGTRRGRRSPHDAAARAGHHAGGPVADAGRRRDPVRADVPALVTREAGFDRDPVLIVGVNADAQRLPAGAARRALRAAASGGGRGAGRRQRRGLLHLAGRRPPAGTWCIAVPPDSPLGRRERMTWVNAVSPDWFSTFGMRWPPAATSSRTTRWRRRKSRWSTGRSRSGSSSRATRSGQEFQPGDAFRPGHLSGRSASSRTPSTGRCAPR